MFDLRGAEPRGRAALRFQPDVPDVAGIPFAGRHGRRDNVSWSAMPFAVCADRISSLEAGCEIQPCGSLIPTSCSGISSKINLLIDLVYAFLDPRVRYD